MIAANRRATVLLGCFLTSCGIAAGPRPSAPVSGGAVVATIRLRDYGTDVVAGADGRVHVAVGKSRLQTVDADTGTVVAETTLESRPYALAVAPDGQRLWVADLAGQYVWRVDAASGRVAARMPVGVADRPSMSPTAAVSRDGRRVYVADTAHDELLAIAADRDAVEKDVFLDLHPAGVAPSPDGRLVYVAGCKLACTDGTLLAIDVTTWAVVDRIAMPAAASGLTVTPDGRRAYVLNGRDATVTAVDLRTRGLEAIPVAPSPTGIAIDPAGRFVYVTSFATGALQAIAVGTNTVVASATIGRDPRAITISRDGTRAYVTHSSPVLSVVDLGRLR